MGRLAGVIDKLRLRKRFSAVRSVAAIFVILLSALATLLVLADRADAAGTDWVTDAVLAKSDTTNEALHIPFSQYPITSYCGDRLMAFPYHPGPGNSNGNNFNGVSASSCDRDVSSDGGPGAWFPNNANWMTARHSLRTGSPDSPWVAATNTGVYGRPGMCPMASGVLKSVDGVDTLWAHCNGRFDRGLSPNVERGVENTNANTRQMLTRAGSPNVSRLGSSAVVRSAGSSLIRKVFVLTEEQCALIKDPENMAGYRPFFEIQGDDWYIAYLNGNELIRQTFTALTYNSSTDPNFINALRSHVSCGATEYERTNVLAIQVTDKAMYAWYWGVDSSSHAAGIRYKFSLQSVRGYDLRPTVAVDRTIVLPNSTVTLQAHVNNPGTTSSPQAQWEVVRFVVPPNAAIPTGGEARQVPTRYFSGSTRVTGGTGVVFPLRLVSLSLGEEQSQPVGNYAAGSRLCFALSVNPYAPRAVSSEWRHSAPACVLIARAPTAQVLGSDLYAGRTVRGITLPSGEYGAVQTRTSVAAGGGTYGSFAEYGIIASGPVKGMASGAGNVNGATRNLDLLSFPNSGNTTASCGTSGAVGCFVHAGYMANVAGYFKPSGKTLSGNVQLVTVESAVYTATSNLRVSASTIPVGHWVVINAPDRDVTIVGDIRYSDAPVSDPLDIPQVVIIARNITIEAAVTNVDAWLVSTGIQQANGMISNGVIKTCDGGACDKRLTINGPVMAYRLQMLRTAGTAPTDEPGAPAEVFNLRPDAYIWGYSYAANNRPSLQVRTVMSKELPPRF